MISSLEEYEAVVGTFINEVEGKSHIVPSIGPRFGRVLEMGCIAKGLGVG